MTYASPQLEQEIHAHVDTWRGLLRDPSSGPVPAAQGIAVEFAFQRAAQAEGLPHVRMEHDRLSVPPNACVWVPTELAPSAAIAQRLALARCVVADGAWKETLAQAGVPALILARPARNFRP